MTSGIDISTDSRFRGLAPFAKKQWLSSPTMHGYEQKWVDEAIQTNWVSTVKAQEKSLNKLLDKLTKSLLGD